MNYRIAKTAVMLAFTVFSTVALAQGPRPDSEPPGRVGRVSLAQGGVSISGGVGDTGSAALVNWPVTTRNLITTRANGRSEVRVGSTAIRIDGDSSLEVSELDDDSVRLRLHYGSASIRIVNDDVLSEFELGTPQGRVRMTRPGRLRVDAERERDTSVVSVFEGEAQLEGGGASLTIRAGRSAELRDDDVRTMQAQRDAFDDWALARDRAVDGTRSARYVTTEMTGYEELDRHGTWQEHVEYGPLWTPRVSASWAPYRDGSWTWVAPWGWTWVDNAPWAYAPSHYGRWVQVRNRWAWAPGHRDYHGGRPVWAPALVGWVGGGSGNVNIHLHGARPSRGWYPLGPRDHFVPHYRLSDEHLRRLNSRRERAARRDTDRDGIPDRFDRDRDGDGIPNVVDSDHRRRDRDARRDTDRDGIAERFNRVQRPPVAATPVVMPGHVPSRADAVTASPAVQEPVRAQPWVRAGRDNERERPERWSRGDREDRGERFEGRRERPQPVAPVPQQAAPAMPPPQAIAAPPPRVMAPPPMAAPSAPSPARTRLERRTETLDNNRPDERMP